MRPLLFSPFLGKCLQELYHSCPLGRSQLQHSLLYPQNGRRRWEQDQADYMGADSFDNISRRTWHPQAIETLPFSVDTSTSEAYVYDTWVLDS